MKTQEYVYTASNDWRYGNMIDGLEYYKAKERKLPDRYVVLCLATTGIYEQSDSIVKIDAARIIHGVAVSEVRSYVKPKSYTPWDEVTTQIDKEYLENAPECRNVLRDLIFFIGDDLVVTNNSVYTGKFIRHSCHEYDFSYSMTMLDFCRIYHFLHPGTEVAEKSAVKQYGMEKYREGDDCIMHLQELYENAVEELHEHGISTVDELDLLWREHLRVWLYRDKKEKEDKENPDRT